MKFSEMNTPNKLTTIRMFCVPVVLILFVLHYIFLGFGYNTDYIIFKDSSIKFSQYLTINQIIILVVFAFASITDFVDGYLARKYNQVSDYGKLMDPLADKLLVNTTLIAMLAFDFFGKSHDVSSFLYVLQFISAIFVILTIARDIFVDALRMQALKKGVVVPAMIWGKLKTATLMPGIVILLIGTVHPVVYGIGLGLILLGGVFAIIGGIKYFINLMPYVGD